LPDGHKAIGILKSLSGKKILPKQVSEAKVRMTGDQVSLKSVKDDRIRN
jgi:hypothetical protein